MPDLTALQTIWFVAIVLLWGLYFVLEGFDFGVGMLIRRVRRDHDDRRVALHAIGPTWAANEVWAVIAVVAMFGAFPGWYGAWASALYLPLTLILLSLIARNVAIELIGKRSSARWRAGWERVLVSASVAAPFLWGLAWSAVVWGIAMRSSGGAGAGGWGGGGGSGAGTDVTASPLDVLSPYSVAGGIAYLLLARAAGAAFLLLRTGEDVRAAAARQLHWTAPLAAVAVGAFLAWTLAAAPGSPGLAGSLAAAFCFAALATLGVAGAGVGAAPAAAPAAPAAPAAAAGASVADGGAVVADRGAVVADRGAVVADRGALVADRGASVADRGAVVADRGALVADRGAVVADRGAAVAFSAACAAIALLLASWFALLFPAGIAGADGGPALALADVAAGSYSLWLMTGVTVLLLPLVVGLQAWSYWLFRHRISRADVGASPPSPVDLVARLAGGDASEPARGPGFRRRRAP